MAERISATLRHLSFEVTDVARSEWFYDRFLGTLGFRRFVRDEGYLGYTDGHLTIWFVRPPTGRVRRKAPTGDEEVVADHLAFETTSPEKVEAFQKELERLDIYPTFRAEEHPEFRPGYFSAVWADPDQVVLEVYAVGKRRRAARARRPAPKTKKKAKPRGK